MTGIISSLNLVAGWSSPVARQAHNLKAVSSNLAPATNGQGNTGCIGRPGGFGGETAPDPIPNSAVKTPSAHGTASQDVGE